MKRLSFLLLFVLLLSCTNEPVPVSVQGIKLDYSDLVICEGESTMISATILPENAENKTIYWSSNKSDVAIVDAGLVKAIAPGTATITAISEDGAKKATCAVTVNPKPISVNGITLENASIRMFINQELTLNATVLPENATNKNILWDSSNKDIAIVDHGLIKAIGLGTTTITAMTEDGGYTAKCKLLIEEECQTQTLGPIVLDLGNVTATTACFSGYINVDVLTEYDMTNGGIGFLYTTIDKEIDINTSQKVQLSNVDSDNKFNHILTDLTLDTEYHYTIFTFKNGICQYGIVQTFKTSVPTIEINNVSVSNTTAQFNGVIHRDQADSDIKVGISYSTSSSLNASSTKREIQPSEDGSYSLVLNNLGINTTYYYTTYIYQNGTYRYGEINEFSTLPVDFNISLTSKTQTTATFSGQIDTGAIKDANYSICIEVENNSLSRTVTIKSGDISNDGVFQAKITGLYPGETYNYQGQLKINNSYSYAQSNRFTTDPLNIDLSIGEITQTTALFSGSMSLTEPYALEIGVYCSTSANELYESSYTTCTKIILSDSSTSDQKFECRVENLKYNTTYYYRYYIKQNGRYTYGATMSFITEDIDININITEVSQTTTTFSGHVDLTEPDCIEVGLLLNNSSNYFYITSSNTTNILLSDKMDEVGYVSHKVNGLLFNTSYNYRYYIKQGTVYTYGDVQTFRTNEVPVSISVNNVIGNIVNIKGKVQFTEQNMIEIGVSYYPENAVDSKKMYKISEISNDGTFDISLTGLLANTVYTYQYYLCQNGQVSEYVVSTFTTEDPYIVQTNLDENAATDLSNSASANCYIISKAGLYKLRSVKGNSNESVGEVSSARIIWETFGTASMPAPCELITEICYKNGYVIFKTNEKHKEGNALIGVVNSDGEILWSWHLWLSDEPKEEVYKNSAGIMLDRNLGATSTSATSAECLGLLYQWGRKDPFINSSSLSGRTIAKSTISWPASENSSSKTGTIEYSIANPTTFIDSNHSMSCYDDWMYKKDNTLWTEDKTIYDPCPPGYKVPDCGEASIWYIAGFADNDKYNSSYKGRYFDIENGTTWYPEGYLYSVDGYLTTGGGRYWSSTPAGRSSYFLYFTSSVVEPVYYDKGLSSYGAGNRASACSVRCVKE